MANSKSLLKQMNNLLLKYGDAVNDVADDVLKKVAVDTVLELKKNPNIPKRTGEYARSFKASKWTKTKRYKGYTVSNELYQLTHLLEYGHATSNGGRTRAFPHFEQAENFAIDELLSKLKEEVEKIK